MAAQTQLHTQSSRIEDVQAQQGLLKAFECTGATKKKQVFACFIEAAARKFLPDQLPVIINSGIWVEPSYEAGIKFGPAYEMGTLLDTDMLIN
jgi:hypothetical protein